MWFYKSITREEFEHKKDLVEKFMLELGAEIFETNLTYDRKTTSISSQFKETNISERPVFKYGDEYFTVDEVLFCNKPFIVVEYGTLTDLLNNTMIDADPFPCNLSNEEIRNEVEFILGIKPYPTT